MFRLVLFPLVGVAASLVACRPVGPNPVPTAPVAELPERITLGRCEMGDTVGGDFTLRNSGASELVLDRIESSCSCSGIERERDGTFVRVNDVRLAAGEALPLRVRVSVRGVPVGATATNVVTYRTNDPDRPDGRLEIVYGPVSGGIFASPGEVVIGNAPVGPPVRQVVDVRDDSTAPRRLGRVTPSRPDRVKVRLLTGDQMGPEVGPVQRGTRIAQLEVEVDCTRSGPVGSTIEMSLAEGGRSPDAIRVVGEVVQPVEVTPDTILLPRRSAEGPIYQATCLVRSANGQALTVAVGECPPHVTVAVVDAADRSPGLVVLSVRLDPAAAGRVPPAGEVIQLRCSHGGREVTVPLTLLARP